MHLFEALTLEVDCILVPDISYVTFSKASEAALAIEEMNGKTLHDSYRPLKVIHNVVITGECFCIFLCLLQ